MGCNVGYWGLGTTANKVAWATFGSTFLIGTALMMAGAIGGTNAEYHPYIHHEHDHHEHWDHTVNCFEYYKNCHGSEGECWTEADHRCDIKTWAGLVITGVLLMALSFLVFVYFCFAKRPEQADSLPSKSADNDKVSINIPALRWQQGAPTQGQAVDPTAPPPRPQ